MVESDVVEEQSIATNGVKEVTAWAEALGLLEVANRYWLATVRPDGRPHVMPLFGVWLDGAFYFTAGERTRKARNLAINPQSVVNVDAPTLDLVVEGEAVKVTDAPTLRHVRDAYASKYGWPLTIQGGTFFAPYGAPSAGPPPYDAYRFTPATAFGLGMTEPYGATRWHFS
jgi:Pyridoxamine 5'-phosphate oxidase